MRLRTSLSLLLLFLHLTRSFRHERHRRVAKADPATSADIKLEQVSNQYKPVFKNCEDFQPSVAEGAERGKRETCSLSFFLSCVCVLLLNLSRVKPPFFPHISHNNNEFYLKRDTDVCLSFFLLLISAAV